MITDLFGAAAGAVWKHFQDMCNIPRPSGHEERIRAHLLDIARGLAASGVTVIYVSHRMSEIFACCDRVSVLRDGKYVATSVVADIDEPTLVEQMIGRRLSTPTAKAADALAESDVFDAVFDESDDDAAPLRFNAIDALDDGTGDDDEWGGA